ncbi:MAG TPA: hypothetical protein VIW67_25000, partial [Terriglobales bacterium]
ADSILLVSPTRPVRNLNSTKRVGVQKKGLMRPQTLCLGHATFIHEAVTGVDALLAFDPKFVSI